MAKAAVLTGIEQPLEIREDVEVAAPKPGEVRVRMAASGVCHSDLSVQNGTIPLPTPIVLGHEGAGVVEEVGEGVTSVKPGDHIVISWVPQCGECFFCTRDQGYLCEKNAATITGGLVDGTTRFSSGGGALFQMAMSGTFSEVSIIPEIIGLGPTIEQTITMTRRGGQAVLVGVPRLDVMLTLPAAFGLVYTAKTVKGCWYGSSNVHRDVTKLLDLYKAGQLKLDELISREIKLDEVNDAFDVMKTGEVARSVIVY
jgi:Zn-dependent alcohol dehydrogenase